jgi:hypothetical protein
MDKRMTDYPCFPLVSVLNHETGLPVSIIVWHVRAVRPIREASVDDDNLTRIEFSNGDVLDVSQSVESVLRDVRIALQPVTDWLAGRSER